jgi:hypothetical protein
MQFEGVCLARSSIPEIWSYITASHGMSHAPRKPFEANVTADSRRKNQIMSYECCTLDVMSHVLDARQFQSVMTGVLPQRLVRADFH